MGRTIIDNFKKEHTLIKILGITAIALLLLVNIAGASPYAYITNLDSSGNNCVSIIDTATNNIVASVKVSNPTYGGAGSTIAVTPDGRKVYVPVFSDNFVAVIDTATNKVVANININDPVGTVVNPDGTKIYVTSYTNKISVIDTATNTVKTTIQLGGNDLIEAAITPDGKKLYVTDDASNVSVIDTATNKVSANIHVSDCPFNIVITPNGKRAYVTHDGHKIALIDIAMNKVIDDLDFGVAVALENLAVSPDGKKVYVGSDFNNISVIDTATNVVIATVNSGYYSENLAFTPDGKKLYAVVNGNVSVIDTATNKVTSVLSVPLCGVISIGPKITLPVAAFTATPLKGKAPLTVNFKNKSTGSPGDYLWTITGGLSFIPSTSTNQNTVGKFTKPGKYTVSLKVTNAAGSSTKIINNCITVT